MIQLVYCQDHLIKENENTILFKVAKFKTGDNPAWKEKNFDDSGWEVIKTALAYEDQGYEGYMDFDWFHYDYK